MKIALFAAVEQEVEKIKDEVHFLGIGRENATRSALEFLAKHKGEELTILNLGTAGAHTQPVGTILRISEIVSGGVQFLDHQMIMDKLPVDDGVDTGVLFSSDCFVTTRVYSESFLKEICAKADCFDMESSAVYSVARHFGIPFVSYKIVSDHLDVDLAEWQRRVRDLSPHLCDFATRLIDKLRQTGNVEII